MFLSCNDVCSGLRRKSIYIDIEGKCKGRKKMRNNRHTEFVKSIRLLGGEKIKENGKVQGTQSAQVNKMTNQEEIDLQKELEKRLMNFSG